MTNKGKWGTSLELFTWSILGQTAVPSDSELLSISGQHQDVTFATHRTGKLARRGSRAWWLQKAVQTEGKVYLLKLIPKAPTFSRAHTASHTQATKRKITTSEGMKRQNARSSAGRSQMITPRPIRIFLVFCTLRFPLLCSRALQSLSALRHEHSGISLGAV